MTQSNWNQEYYDILEFYFWEPQHIGKKKNSDSKLKTWNEIDSHIKEMEVALNHQLNIFFSLAPNSFIETLTSKVFSREIKDQFVFDTYATNRFVASLKDATQPDFLFKGNHELLAIEMKLNAKSSLEQLMKYLLLHVLIEEKDQIKRNFNLIFLIKGDFKEIWKEGYASVDELISAFEGYSIPDVTRKGNLNLIPYKERIIETFRNARIGYCTYSELNQAVFDEIIQVSDSRVPYKEVYQKLLQGLSDELELRGLA